MYERSKAILAILIITFLATNVPMYTFAIQSMMQEKGMTEIASRMFLTALGSSYLESFSRSNPCSFLRTNRDAHRARCGISNDTCTWAHPVRACYTKRGAILAKIQAEGVLESFRILACPRLDALLCCVSRDIKMWVFFWLLVNPGYSRQYRWPSLSGWSRG